MRIGESINELYVDTHLVVRLLHAAFKDVRDAELTRDVWQIRWCAFEALRRCPRNDFQVCNLCQTRDHFVLTTFGKIRGGFIFAQAVEGKDGDRFLRDGRLSSHRRLALESARSRLRVR